LIALIFLSSAVDSRRIRRHRMKTRGGLWQFGLGLITELAGGVQIDTCLPDTWKNATPSDEKEDEKELDGDVVKQSSVWENIKKILNYTVDVICAVKDLKNKILSWVGEQFGIKLRRYIRRFIEGKTTKLFRMRWSFTSWISSAATAIKDAATSVANGVVKVATTTINAVGKAIDKVEGAIKSALTSIFEPIINFFQGIKEKFTNFFKSGIMKKVKDVLVCLKNLGNAAYLIVKTAANIVQIITRLAAGDPIAWVQVIFGLICAWEDLAKAIEYLINGIKETGDKRWNFLGKFAGKLVYTLGNLDWVATRRRLR